MFESICAPMPLKLLVIVWVLFAFADARDTTVLVSPAVLRGLAQTVVLPEYPASSSGQNHTGVAVIELVVSASGKVAHTEVLQSPDPSIAAAVAAALRQWSFRPFLVEGIAHPMRSRLIFYFRMEEHKPLVIDATEQNPVPKVKRSRSAGTSLTRVEAGSSNEAPERR
jgi:TonB family protein